jgi:hypothetical protein
VFPAIPSSMTTHRVARVSGLSFLLLFAGGNLLWWPWGKVRAGDDPALIARYFADHRALIVVGGTLSVLGIAAFVVFASAIRLEIDDPIIGTVAAIGATVTAVAGFGAETINMAGAVHATDDPHLAQTLYEVPQVLGGYTSAVGVGIFALAVAAARLLGRRATWSIITIGVVMLTPLAAYVTEVAGGGLLLVVAITLAAGARS